VFGPRTYTGTGRPVLDRRTFSVQDPSGRHTLRVTNRGVLNAFVALNGRIVLLPRDFSARLETTGFDGRRSQEGEPARQSAREDDGWVREWDRLRRDGEQQDHYDNRPGRRPRPIPLIERDVTLRAGNNNLAVGFFGRRGTSLTIEIVRRDNTTPDTTPPTITATATPAPNASGWHSSGVTVMFTCGDVGGSGVAICPMPVEVTTEGANQTISGTAVDVAGNMASASLTLSIDRTSPTVVASASPLPNADGWNDGAVIVSFSGTDALSGVMPESLSPPVILEIDGANLSAVGQVRDVAGNVGSATLGGINIDQTEPTITVTQSPPPNDYGWNNSLVTLDFTCTDAGSGVSSCTEDQDIVTEGENQTIIGTARDKAGNTASLTTNFFSIDRTPPTITVSLSPPPNTNGWNNESVTADFTCTDDRSGIEICPATRDIATEGAKQVISGATIDRAGNRAVVNSTVNIDQTAPAVTITFPSAEAVLDSPALVVTGSITDLDSGVASVECNDSPATIMDAVFSCNLILSEGRNSIVAEAIDLAGNSGSSGLAVTLVTDKTPPLISIGAPAANSFVFHNQPPIDISYSDEKSGVDLTSLEISADGEPLVVNCNLGPEGGRCTPTIGLPEGPVRLAAAINDLTGNAGSAEVLFNVDSAPLPVAILTPADRLITREEWVAVTGTTGFEVTSVYVNGVAAELNASSFTANVPLRQGTNMLVAVASKANGKTGTATVDVTRDIAVPIVRVQSPRDGMVSVTNTVTVTGVVNDIVNGATDPTVSVNGVAAHVSNGSFVAVKVPLIRGPNTVTATATDHVGNRATHSIAVNFHAPIGPRLVIEAGDRQSAVVKQPLAQPLIVAVKDDNGFPVAGRMVTFEVIRNNGTLQANSNDAPKRQVTVSTDGSGRASVRLTVGDAAGQGNNSVRVTTVGAAGEVEFFATGLPASASRILMTGGDNQRGLIGNPLAVPLEAMVVDADGNPVRNIDVIFSIVQGTGNLNGEVSETVTSSTDGVVRAIFTIGQDPGINNNVVEATFPGNTGLPATYTSSGLTPGDPANTTFTGIVLDNGLTPIPSAAVSIPGTLVAATTDTDGHFTLLGVPVGHIHLRIDPANSPRPERFPPLEFETVTVAGQQNTLGQPILIPALDMSNARIVGGDQDVVLTMDGVSGVELKVFKNSVTFPDGSKTGEIVISQVHLDKVPMAPPRTGAFMGPAWTIQPSGVHFDPPARITIPNDGHAPGSIVDIYQFDHDIGMFISIGKGRVSTDGARVEIDDGFGILAAFLVWGWSATVSQIFARSRATKIGGCQDLANRSRPQLLISAYETTE
jgi:hypothetical protein